MHWHDIALVVASRREVLYLIGQYEPQEPLVSWWFRLQADWLMKRGYVEDADARLWETLEMIQSGLRRSGCDLKLSGRRARDDNDHAPTDERSIGTP